MNTGNIHRKFKEHFGNDYRNKDIEKICRFILRQLGQKDKNPVQTIKQYWSKACWFLINWTGKQENANTKMKQPDNTPFKPTVSGTMAAFKEKGVVITEEQAKAIIGEICPYCKQKPEYVDSVVIYGKSYGMVYYCKKCDAYCGVHKGTDISLGRLANKELREWKKKAHDAFDPLHKSNYMKRHEAYSWLSEKLNIPRDYTHIGMFGIETCKKVYEICLKELQ